MAADVNSKLVDPRCALRVQLAETDVFIRCDRYCSVELMGTVDQLRAEGFTDIGDRLPSGRRSSRWEDDCFRYFLFKQSPSELRPLYGGMVIDGIYLLRIYPRNPRGWVETQLRLKLEEMEEIKRVALGDYREECLRAGVARSDSWFQEKLQLIVGPTTPRRRGGTKRRPVA